MYIALAVLPCCLQDGSLQRLSQQLVDSRQEKPRQRPYSMLLAQVGLAGVQGRMGGRHCVAGCWSAAAGPKRLQPGGQPLRRPALTRPTAPHSSAPTLQPHLKLNAAMGCLARMPLPPLRGFSFPQASLEPLEPHGSGSSGQAGGSSSRAAHARQASSSSLISRASYSSQLAEAWQPYFK